MEPKISLTYSQKFVTAPYPEAAEFSSHIYMHYLCSISVLFCDPCLGVASGYFLRRFQTKVS